MSNKEELLKQLSLDPEQPGISKKEAQKRQTMQKEAMDLAGFGMGSIKKVSSSNLVKKLMEKGGIHFSPEQGGEGGLKLSQKQALKQLRDAGVDATPTGGMYKGQKEGSIFVANPDEKAVELIKKLAGDTKQESILVVKPGQMVESSFEYLTGKSEPLGKGMKISKEQPPGEYWTKFSTKDGPRYVEYGTGHTTGTHYGKPGLNELDPAFQGTGTDASKFARNGKPQTAYSSAYLPGTAPEANVLSSSGTTPHNVNLDMSKLYDINLDPQGFMRQAQQDMVQGNFQGNPLDYSDLARTRIMEAGFEGITRPDFGSAELFKKLPTFAEGGLVRKGYAQGGIVSNANSAGIPIFNISSGQPVLGSVPAEQVQEALMSGEYMLPKGVQVPVLNPMGERGTVPSEQIFDALQNGFQYETPQMFKQAKYGTGVEQLKAGAEGVLKGVLGPGGPLLQTEVFGADPEDIRGRAEANPITHGVGEFAGLLSPVGEGALLMKAGAATSKATKAAVAAGKEIGAVANLAGGAARGAVEMALFQTGDELSKYILEDPSSSVDSALAHIGLSSLIGGGLGGAFAAVPVGWKGLAESKAGKWVNDFKSRARQHLDNPEPVRMVQDELTNLHNIVKETGPAFGLKKEELRKLMANQDTEVINKSAPEIIGKFEELMGKVKNKNGMEGVLHQLEQDYMELNQALRSGPSELFEGLDLLKRKFGRYEFKGAQPFTPQANFAPMAHEFRTELMGFLENTKVWGKVGERQKAFNKSFSKLLTPLKEFEKLSTTELAGERLVDPGKIETYLNSLGKHRGEFKQDKVENFVKAARKFQEELNNTHASLGLAPIEEVALTHTNRTLKDLSAGEKAADAFIKTGMGQLAAAGAGSLFGALAGGGLGAGVGAVLGKQVLGSAAEKIMPVIMKSLLSNAPSGAALRSVTELGHAIMKGEQRLNNLAVGILNKDAKSEGVADITKLQKKVEEFKTNPQMLMNHSRQVAYYMPDHEANLSTSAARSLSYLAALSPKTAPSLPLDKPMKASKPAEGRYKQALQIAENPLSIGDKIKKGTLTSQNVDDLKAMYPALYNRMSSKLIQELAERMSDNKSIPYQTRLGLATFLGRPLDSTMLPQAIISNQPQPAPEPQGAAQPSKTGMGKMKQAQIAQTPEQAREAARSR